MAGDLGLITSANPPLAAIASEFAVPRNIKKSAFLPTRTKACDLLVFNIGQLVTNADTALYRRDPSLSPPPAGPKTGLTMGMVGLASNVAMAVIDGEVVDVGPSPQFADHYTATATVDAGGALVSPGFVDPHTHPVFASHRALEFEMRLKGTSYEEIAVQGGGILNSVRKLRAMGETELLARTLRVFDEFIKHGTTTIEAKTGYGLDAENELKMLRVLSDLHDSHFLDVAITFLGAHEVPDEFRINGQ